VLSDKGAKVSEAYGSALDIPFLGRFSNRQTYIISPVRNHSYSNFWGVLVLLWYGLGANLRSLRRYLPIRVLLVVFLMSASTHRLSLLPSLPPSLPPSPFYRTASWSRSSRTSSPR